MLALKSSTYKDSASDAIEKMGALCSGEKDGGRVKLQTTSVTIRDTIAEGGFSTVYKATDEIKTYAIKQIICQEAEQIAGARKEIEVDDDPSQWLSSASSPLWQEGSPSFCGGRCIRQ